VFSIDYRQRGSKKRKHALELHLDVDFTRETVESWIYELRTEEWFTLGDERAIIDCHDSMILRLGHEQ
jgi:hypothetical protein